MVNRRRWEKGTAVDREHRTAMGPKLDPLSFSLSSKSPLFNQEECGESPPLPICSSSRPSSDRNRCYVVVAVTGQIQFGTAAPNSFSRCRRLRQVRRQREEQQRRPRPGPNLPNGIWNNFWTSAKRCEVTDGANETRMPRMTGLGCCVGE